MQRKVDNYVESTVSTMTTEGKGLPTHINRIRTLKDLMKSTFIFFCFLLVSCASNDKVQTKPLTYNGTDDIYPAVFYAFQQLNTYIETVDTNSHSYLSNYIYDKDGILDIRFKLLVTRANNLIDVDLIDYSYRDSSGRWPEKAGIENTFDSSAYRLRVLATLKELLKDTEFNKKYAFEHTLERALYPAVYHLFNNVNTVIVKADIDKEEYESGIITAIDNGNDVSYRLLITLENNFVVLSLKDFSYRNTNNDNGLKWIKSIQPLNRYFMHDYALKLLANFKNSLDDASNYEKQKNAALNDLFFNYQVMRNMEQDAVNNWITGNNIDNREIKLDQMIIVDLKENNNNSFSHYKYIARLGFNPTKLVIDAVNINYYTNDKQLAALEQGSMITTNGKLAKIAHGSNLSEEISDNTLHLDIISK